MKGDFLAAWRENFVEVVLFNIFPARSYLNLTLAFYLGERIAP
jgi:hypothetical protein